MHRPGLCLLMRGFRRWVRSARNSTALFIASLSFFFFKQKTAYEIKILDILDIELESSFLVLARNMGKLTTVKTWSYLLLGPDTEKNIVDTGAQSPEIMQRLAMKGIQSEEMKLENQLAAHGVKMDDVRWI